MQRAESIYKVRFYAYQSPHLEVRNASGKLMPPRDMLCHARWVEFRVFGQLRLGLFAALRVDEAFHAHGREGSIRRLGGAKKKGSGGKIRTKIMQI